MTFLSRESFAKVGEDLCSSTVGEVETVGDHAFEILLVVILLFSRYFACVDEVQYSFRVAVTEEEDAD